LLDLRTGEKRTVLETGQPEQSWRSAVSSDAKSLYGIRETEEGDIWMMEAGEGARF